MAYFVIINGGNTAPPKTQRKARIHRLQAIITDPCGNRVVYFRIPRDVA